MWEGELLSPINLQIQGYNIPTIGHTISTIRGMLLQHQTMQLHFVSLSPDGAYNSQTDMCDDLAHSCGSTLMVLYASICLIPGR